MNIWQSLGRHFLNSTPRRPSDWFMEWVRGESAADSGITVNAQTALTYAAVWQAVNVVAGDLGQLPLNVYRNTPDGKERDRGHAAYRLLRRRANSMMSAGTLIETLQAHALITGNGRAGILRNALGAPLALIPFLPDRSDSAIFDGELYHCTRLGDDTTHTWFHDRDVLHIKGLGFDGIKGYSVITLARNSFGLGLATERMGNTFFKNSARPSVILETENTFQPEAAKQLLSDWERMHAGDNYGRTALLQKGTKAHVLSVSNDDAQWLETRAFQKVEVASWFNLPPHKLGDSSKVAYNSLEQENQSYLNMALMRWVVKWQDECFEKLLTPKEKESESHFVEFNTAALLRGDLAARYAAYQVGIANEFLSPDEVRGFENLNKRPDGKGGQYRNPNTKSDKAPTEPAPADKPKPAAHTLIAKRLHELQAVERKRVEHAAAKSKNFCEWLDEFYSGWAERFTIRVEDYGGTAEQATAYVDASKAALMALTETSTQETLAADVKRLMDTWPARADDLAASIQKGMS